MKNTLLIINPISGTLSKDGLSERVKSQLLPQSFSVDTIVTERAGHAKELAEQASERGYEAVIVAGGDGTVNEVGSGLRHTGVAMGILPFGSGNGLARHIMVNIDIDHALSVIAKGCAEDCDYGIVNDHPFFCTFGLGFDAKVSREFALMPSRGLPSYIKSAMQEYLRYTPSEYIISTKEGDINVKAFIVAACNASQYGNNAFIAPAASIRDGMLDITIIHSGNPITRAVAGIELFTGNLDRNILMQTLRTDHVKIKHFPGPGHVDGEPMMMPETIDVKCEKGGIKLFIDPDKPKFRPILTPIESMRQDSSFLIKENMRIALKNFRDKIEKIF